MNYVILAVSFLALAVIVTTCSPDGSDLIRPPEVDEGVTWKEQGAYSGDCINRPEGTVCIKYDDDYIWLVQDSISGWESRDEDNRKIQVAIGFAGRYEHILDTNLVRLVQ